MWREADTERGQPVRSAVCASAGSELHLPTGDVVPRVVGDDVEHVVVVRAGGQQR